MAAMIQTPALHSRAYVCISGKTVRARAVAVRPAGRVSVKAVRAQDSRPEEASAKVARRAALQVSALALTIAAVPAPSLATPRRKQAQMDPDLYRPIPGTSPEILYYDLKSPGGTEGGVKRGQRVAVHYDVKWKGLTIATSRQGAGVTGGVPYGYDVGGNPGDPGAPFMKAFNEGIQGMGVGTVRTMIVPPEYAFGKRGQQEIPPNATLTLDLELLSIKKDNIFGK